MIHLVNKSESDHTYVMTTALIKERVLWDAVLNSCIDSVTLQVVYKFFSREDGRLLYKIYGGFFWGFFLGGRGQSSVLMYLLVC